MTGVLLDGVFVDPIASDNRDGFTYRNLDGDAELLVFGGHDLFDGVNTATTFAHDAAFARGDSVDYLSVDATSFLMAGTLAGGGGYFRYSLAGETREGDPVFATILLSYPDGQGSSMRR